MSDEPNLSRRNLLAAGGALLALSACDPQEEEIDPAGDHGGVRSDLPDPSARRDTVGTIAAVDGDVVRVTTGTGEMSVRLPAGGTIDHPTRGRIGVSSLAPGMDVVVVEERQAGAWQVSEIVCVFTHVHATITGRSGDRLESTAGVLRIGPTSEAWGTHDGGRIGEEKPLELLASGDEVRGLAFRDPASGELVIHRLVTLPKGTASP